MFVQSSKTTSFEMCIDKKACEFLQEYNMGKIKYNLMSHFKGILMQFFLVSSLTLYIISSDQVNWY